MRSLAAEFGRTTTKLTTTAWWSLPTALFLAGTTVLLRYRESDAWLVFLLALALPALYSSLSRIVYQRRKLVGIVFYIACCGAQATSALALTEWVWDLPILKPEPTQQAAIIALILATLATLLVIPFAVFPHLQQKKMVKKAAGTPSLEASTIGRSFHAIKTNFTEIQASVRREMTRVDESIRNLQDKISTQERQLERAKHELESTLRELEEYKALNSLSREQQEAFLRLLGRQKYQEYFIGFVLGIIGSALVTMASEMLR